MFYRQSRTGRSAFTLIELLVVIAIIAILVAMLLPAVQQVREAARKSQCQDHLHNYGVAIHSYEGVHKMLPIGGVPNQTDGASGGCCNGGPRVGWQVRALPFMEQKALYDAVSMSSGIGAAAPLPARATDTLISGRRAGAYQVSYARCPSDPWPDSDGSWASASYTGSLGSQSTPSNGGAACEPFQQFAEVLPAGNSGHGNSNNNRQISGVFSRMGAPVGFNHIIDGTSNVIFVGETLFSCHDHREGWWSNNGAGNAHSSTVVPINNWNVCDGALPSQITHPACTAKDKWNFTWGFRSMHAGGAQFCMGDAKVTFVSENIDHTAYQRLGGRADGQTVKVP